MKRIDLKGGFSCNNNCKFCILGDKRDNFEDRTTKEMISLIEKYGSKGYKKIVLTGGEITLRRDIFKLIEKSKESGFELIRVESNGRMFKYKDYLSRLISSGANCFSVSFYASNAKDYSFLSNTSEESFFEVLEGLKNLSKYDVKVDINCVINKKNYRKLKEIIDLVNKFNFSFINFPLINPSGNVLNHKDSLLVSFSQVKPYIRRALEYCEELNIHPSTEMFPFCVLGKNYKKSIEYYSKDMSIDSPSNKVNDFEESRSKGKLKLDNCSNCLLNDKCEGILKSYYKQFDSLKVFPITNLDPFEMIE
ncbi:MAG: radical SAM protein [Candidatus Woesearchaeota archaeon]